MKVGNSRSQGSASSVNRRHFLAGMAGAAVLSAVDRSKALAAVVGDVTVNLAKVATASASYTSGDTKLSSLNDGFNPASSRDQSHGTYGNWPRTDPQWVQYEWSKPVATNHVDVYWWADRGGIGIPASYRVTYWNGSEFVPVPNAQGLGLTPNGFNSTTFDEVKTDKLRLEITSDGTHSTGITGVEGIQQRRGTAFSADRRSRRRPRGRAWGQDISLRESRLADAVRRATRALDQGLWPRSRLIYGP